jgi:hypothetical protein
MAEKWSHGPVFNFLRDGKPIDQWAFDHPKTPDEALAWYNRTFPRFQADTAKQV